MRKFGVSHMQPKLAKKKRSNKRQQQQRWVPMALIGAFALLAVLLIVLMNLGIGENNNKPPKVTAIPVVQAPQQGNILGEPNATLTMIEYFRYDCPHCRNIALNVAPLLEKDYVETGKLKIELRALSLEGEVLDASAAAYAAGDQGKFWEYSALLFENVDRGFSKSDLKEYAKLVGLDVGKWQQAFDSQRYHEKVLGDTNEFTQAGFSGVPLFFIGPSSKVDAASPTFASFTRVEGERPYDAFKKAIDEELAKNP
jgi:protein-disulfide isomerase